MILSTRLRSREPRGRWPRETAVVLAFTAIIAVLVLLCVLCFDVLSGVRAYVSGESLWSKAQKRAVGHLHAYARTGSTQDWQRYLDAIAIPLAVRRAREALEAPVPDVEEASAGFLHGGNAADDVDGLVRLFRWTRHLPAMGHAIDIWRQADAELDAFTHVADTVHQRLMAGAGAATLGPLMASAREIDDRLTRLEVDFSARLGAAARTAQAVVTGTVVALAGLMVIAGALFARRVGRRRDRLEEDLRQSEARLRRAVTGSGDGLWDWNMETQEVYVSRRMEAFLGYEPDSLPRTVMAMKALVHPADREHTRRALSAHLKKGEPYDVEMRLRTHDGSWRWVRSRALARHDGAGGPRRMAGSVTDITERRLAEEALREANELLELRVAERTGELTAANERLRQMDRLKTEFLAAMSHELRTPLNAILGFSALLREGHGGPLSEEQARHVGFVHDAGEHLLALINDLLDVTRIETGRAELSVDDFDLAVVIGQVAASLGPMVQAKGLSFACETGASPLPMRGDRRRCFQVLLNLAGNAVKFTDAGGVRIAAAAVGERVEIVVSDTGIGIAPEHMPMLFEAFRQLCTGHRRAREGTGLGLHLSRRLVEAMGGSIRARSTPGEGSVFTVLMPRTAMAQACESPA